LVMTKKKSRVQGKHRSFCFTMPQGYTIEDKSFDPDAVQEAESVTIGFQKTNDR
jgi:hypothetical protein